MSLMEMNALTTLIRSIAKRGLALDKDIQKAAVSAIGYSVVDRNSTPADQLFKALAKGHRRDKLATFFEQHGNLAYMKADDAIKFYDAGIKVWTDDMQAELLTTPWTGATKAAVVSKYDVDDAISKLFKNADKALKEGRVESEEDKSLLKAMHAAYARWLVENAKSESDDEIILHDGDTIDAEVFDDGEGSIRLVVNG